MPIMAAYIDFRYGCQWYINYRRGCVLRISKFPMIFSAGIVIAAYGSGHIRIFSVAEACIVAEAAAHAGPFIAIANNFNQYNY